MLLGTGGLLDNINFNYGIVLPSILFILCIVLTYWVIAPLLLILGFVYFLYTYYILKYKFLYIFIPNFETGGIFWYKLYKYSMIGLFVSSFTMIGYLAVKEGVSQAPFLLPLPIVIYYFWNKTVNTFEYRTMNVPFSKAKEFDSAVENEFISAQFDVNYYAQPCLIAPSQVNPAPYRIGGKPILNENEEINSEYFKESFEANFFK
jgi:hypothetical protein